MMSSIQNNNLESLKFMTRLFQSKTLDSNTPFYDCDIPFTFLYPNLILSLASELNNSDENIKITSNKTITSGFELFAGHLDKKENIVESLDKRVIESIKLLIEKITTNKENICKILENLHRECEEEGFETFDEKARTNARKILDFLCEKFPEYDFDVYPTEDREIEIYHTPGKGRGILITCDSEGSVAYFKTDDKDSRHRCQDINDFPFELLCEEIESLKRPKTFNISSIFEENPTILSQQNKFKITEVSSEYKIA